MIAKEIFEFMKVVEKLSFIYRDTKLSNGELESDAHHSFKLCYLVMLTAPYLTKHKPDVLKMMKIALVHDLVEVYAGDTSLCQQNKTNIKNKIDKEKKALELCLLMLPDPLKVEVHDLYMEYENRQTIESKIVYVLDKIDAKSQANFYEDVRYWGETEGGYLYYDLAKGRAQSKEDPFIDELDEDILRDLKEYIKEIGCKNMAKHGIE